MYVYVSLKELEDCFIDDHSTLVFRHLQPFDREGSENNVQIVPFKDDCLAVQSPTENRLGVCPLPFRYPAKVKYVEHSVFLLYNFSVSF